MLHISLLILHLSRFRYISYLTRNTYADNKLFINALKYDYCKQQEYP